MDVLYTTAPDTTPLKLFLCEVVTFGGSMNLVVFVPASAKSTADFNSVAPTPTPPKQTEQLTALISVSSNMSVDLIETCPFVVIKIRFASVSLI